MVSLSCTATREDGVTLVTGHVRNPGRPRRVRLANDLDGPVWPPRTSGVPVAGWEDDTFECIVDAGEVRPVGYATPAPPADEPMTVVASEPADADSIPETAASSRDTSPVPEVENSPAGVVRALGSPRPPRDAVPTPDIQGGSEPAEPAEPSNESAEPSITSEQPTAATGTAGQGDARVCDDLVEPGGDALETWLDTVERRLVAAEALSSETRVDAATEAVAQLGGLDGVRTLEGHLADDAARLRTLTTRAERLAERAESVEVAVDSIERLA
jgi:hypothetical protein